MKTSKIIFFSAILIILSVSVYLIGTSFFMKGEKPCMITANEAKRDLLIDVYSNIEGAHNKRYLEHRIMLLEDETEFLKEYHGYD